MWDANYTSIILLLIRVIRVMRAMEGEAECREDTERSCMCPLLGENLSGRGEGGARKASLRK